MNEPGHTRQLSGRWSTAYRAAQVVRAETVTTRSRISSECGTRSAGHDRTNELCDARIVEILHRKFGKADGVALCGDLGFVVGVDVEGERISVAAANAQFASLDIGVTADTAGAMETDASGTLDLIAKTVAQTIEVAAASLDGRRKPFGVERLIGVGLALPGPIRRGAGQVSSATQVLRGWRGLKPGDELKRRLQGLLGISPDVVIENDASVGALGVFTKEVLRANDLDGAPRDLIYVRVGEGVGAGIILEGKLIGGSSGFAGELGHIKVDNHGPLCPRCGQRGCVETKSAAPYLVRQIVAMDQSIIEFEQGDDKLRRLIESRHPACGRALWGAGWYVGVALAHASSLLDPKRVYVGGTTSESADFLAALEQAIHQTAVPTVGRTLRHDATALTTTGVLKRGESAFPSPPHDFVRQVRKLGFDRSGITPELLGAMALVINTVGDRAIQKKIEIARDLGP